MSFFVSAPLAPVSLVPKSLAAASFSPAFLALASLVLADVGSLVLCCLVLAKPGLISFANPHALRSLLFSSAPASLTQAVLVSSFPISPFLVFFLPVSLSLVYLGLASLVLISLGSTNACHPPLNPRSSSELVSIFLAIVKGNNVIDIVIYVLRSPLRLTCIML